MAIDYSRLRGRIVERYGSQMSFAKAMNISERTLSLKMSGKRDWKQLEIRRAINLLGLSDGDIVDYFFKIKVQ